MQYDDGDQLLGRLACTFVRAPIDPHRSMPHDAAPNFPERRCYVQLRMVREGVDALSSPRCHIDTILHLNLEVSYSC